MPPKLDRCVRAVKPRTGTSRAYAICTASLQRAGELPRKKTPMSTKAQRSASARKAARTRKRNAMKFENPRTPCGSVSSKRNKYVGSVFTKVRGAAKGTRRVIGCAKVGDDEGYYATRKVGAKGTRYTPIKKRALRDLKSNHKGAIKIAKHRGVKHTSAALASAFEARYAPKPKKRAVKNPSRKMSAADKAAFVKRMAAARARKAR